MMGCDIHIYPEYRKPEYGGWVSFGRRINPGRNYDLFGKIAGVRGDGQLFPVTGLPEELGYWASADSQLYVTETGDGEGCCSRVSAERWVAGGSSEWTDERKACVTHPDWHTHTSLTAPQFRQAIEACKDWPVEDSYWALLAAVEELERRGNDTRLVIWFDN